MTTIKLKEPVPKAKKIPAAPRAISISGQFPLPDYADRNLPALDQILQKRRSRRKFRQISVQDFADFLWLTLRPQNAAKLKKASPQYPLPSFGALQSVRCLFLNAPEIAGMLSIYDPYRHALGIIPVAPGVVRKVFAAYSKLVPIRNAVLILFVVDVRRAMSAYQNVESLVWRDVGVLLGGMTVVSEALGLSYCILGKIGRDEVAQLVPRKDWCAVGAAVFGARAD